MTLLPPQIIGPLSECNRSIIIDGAVPGCQVTVVVTRGGADRRVAEGNMNTVRGIVKLFPQEELQSDDIVKCFLTFNGDQSIPSGSDIIVQKSAVETNSAQLADPLVQCALAAGFTGVRPGVTVELIAGATSIASGEALDGTVTLFIPSGVPAAVPGAPLIARQTICPKPPPVPPAPSYVLDQIIPYVEASPLAFGQNVPAPIISEGLSACSRSVSLKGILPGAVVVTEGLDGGWQARQPTLDIATTMPLPVSLRAGERVAVSQELSNSCRLISTIEPLQVADQRQLPAPLLSQVACNTISFLPVGGLKPGADVEISVMHDGAEEIFRAAVPIGTSEPSSDPKLIPAPPMPDQAEVKLRQGECDVWSDWSSPVIKVSQLSVQVDQIQIRNDLFSCQDTIFVENIKPVGGTLRIVSRQRNVIGKKTALKESEFIHVAPSLALDDEVWAEYNLCSSTAMSEKRRIKRSYDLGNFRIQDPIYVGYTEVLVVNALAGARIELWEGTRNTVLAAVRSPYGVDGRPDNGIVDFKLVGLVPLEGGWQIYAKMFYCGKISISNAINIMAPPPEISNIYPAYVDAGSPTFTMQVYGSNFQNGARMVWNNRPTQFVTAALLNTLIHDYDVKNAYKYLLSIRNPDGQLSNAVGFEVRPAQAAPSGSNNVQASELVFVNCNPETDNNGSHRSVRIWVNKSNDPQHEFKEIQGSPLAADYTANGYCPSDMSNALHLKLDDGVTYEVVCTDEQLQSCKPDGVTPLALTAGCQIRTSQFYDGKKGAAQILVSIP